MQTARIIPYMRRNARDEFKRRTAAALESAWMLALLPALMVQAVWLTAVRR